MSNDTDPARISREDLKRIYEATHTIAVVGASDEEGKPAHDVPAYLQEHGYKIVPVNPKGGEILGERSVATLQEVDVPVDVVQVFRRPEAAEQVAKDAIEFGARILWFQPGTHTDEAAQLARDAGITVVTKRCMRVVHRDLGLGSAS